MVPHHLDARLAVRTAGQRRPAMADRLRVARRLSQAGGVGEAQIKMDLDQNKRVALVNEAVREILSRYPPKK